MKKVAFAIGLIVMFTQSASAAITHSLSQSSPAGLPAGVVAWDLEVNVTGGDDWTASQLNATASSGSFVDPNALNTYSPGVNDADTWFEATSGFTGFAQGPSIAPASISATWFDTENGGSGTFVIARILTTADATFTITGASTTVQGGGALTTFAFTVPSPGAIGVIAVAAIIGRQRRR